MAWGELDIYRLGGVHGIALIVHKIFLKKYIISKNRISTFFSIICTYVFVCICWIFFRADSITTAITIIERIFKWGVGINYIYSYTIIYGIVIFGIGLFVWIKSNGNGFYLVLDLKKIRNRFIFFLSVFILILLSYLGDTAFIYFQF